MKSVGEQTVIELTGKDRPGLLSEVSAVLTDNKCNVTAAEVWTHNLRVACVVYVTDEATLGPIEDYKKMEKIKEALMKVMRGSDDKLGAKTDFVEGYTHIERRLHQMMFADQDYEVLDRRVKAESFRDKSKPIIGVHHCSGYSLINVQCPDRPKLLFDIVCTLTDMQYVVFHATIDTADDAIAVQVCSVVLYQIILKLLSLNTSNFSSASFLQRCSLLLQLPVGLYTATSTISQSSSMAIVGTVVCPEVVSVLTLRECLYAGFLCTTIGWVYPRFRSRRASEEVFRSRH